MQGTHKLELLHYHDHCYSVPKLVRRTEYLLVLLTNSTSRGSLFHGLLKAAAVQQQGPPRLPPFHPSLANGEPANDLITLLATTLPSSAPHLGCECICLLDLAMHHGTLFLLLPMIRIAWHGKAWMPAAPFEKDPTFCLLDNICTHWNKAHVGSSQEAPDCFRAV